MKVLMPEAPYSAGHATRAEGYSKKDERPVPYHGYYYKILKAQGPHAPGGARDYVQKGLMLAFVIWAEIGLTAPPDSAGQYNPSFFPGELINLSAYTAMPFCAGSSMAYFCWASTYPSQSSMVSSSLAPILRASSSVLPASVSNRQRLAFRTSGTANGSPSLPVRMTTRLASPVSLSSFMASRILAANAAR